MGPSSHYLHHEYLANPPDHTWPIILRSDDCDLHVPLDLLAKELKPTQADIQLSLTAELLKAMLSSMDSEWDRKVARLLLGSNRSLLELHNLGMT